MTIIPNDLVFHFAFYLSLTYLGKDTTVGGRIYSKEFIKISGAVIDGMNFLEMFNVSIEECAEQCYVSDTCTTFQFYNTLSECEFYGIRKYQQSNATDLNIDVYHLREHIGQCCPISLMNGVGISEDKRFREEFLPFENCVLICYYDSWCKTVSFSRWNGMCFLSNYTSYNATVSHLDDNWQYVEFTKYEDSIGLPNIYNDEFVSLPICNQHDRMANRNFLQEFIAVKAAEIYGKRIKRMFDHSVEECAEKCYESKKCRSFVISVEKHYCDIYHVNTREKPLLSRSEHVFYQRRVQPSNKCCPMSIVPGAVLPPDKMFSERVLSFVDCLSMCYNDSWCNTVNYNKRSETCLTTNYTSFNASILFSVNAWQHIEFSKYLPFKTHETVDGLPGVVNCHPDHFLLYINDTSSEGDLFVNFIKVNKATINGMHMRMMSYVSIEDCEKDCIKVEKCKSFIFEESNQTCIHYPFNTQQQRIEIGSDTDFYQQRIQNLNEGCPISAVYGAVLPKSTTVFQLATKFIDCLSICYNSSWCKAVNYNTKSKTCLTTNYTSYNATVSATKDDWIFAVFKQDYVFETYQDEDNVVILKNCVSDKFRMFYFKIEEKKDSAIQTTRFTKSMNSYTFTKLFKCQTVSSRITCAINCNHHSKCLAFQYEMEKRKNCCFLKFY